MKIYKKLVVLEKDNKKFYTFYVLLENGVKVRIQPNTYIDKEGVKHSNYNELVLIAYDELPFDN